MRVFKWLKRDKSERRCSDSAAMGLSADPEFLTSATPSRDDTIRTAEYKKALSDFFARRSLGGGRARASLDDVDCHPRTPTSSKDHDSIANPNRRLVQSERKASASSKKRRSLPVSGGTTSVSPQDVPHIQFLFSNQIFMPGSGLPFLRGGAKTKKDKYKSKKRQQQQQEGSLVSTSPDLLPPRFLRDLEDDNDAADGPSSPPGDFFTRTNSLPYRDVPATPGPQLGAAASEDCYVNDEESNKGDTTATLSFEGGEGESRSFVESPSSTAMPASTESGTFDAMARKLEKMCRCTSTLNRQSNFRGIPLVTMNALEYHDEIDLDKKWLNAKWKCVSVAVKKSPKTWCSPGEKLSLNHFIAQDLDILTKIRHPNILLLMGICCNKNTYAQSFYEECVSTLNDYIHDQANILSLQTSLQYLSGIANALAYLKLNNYVHTAVSSHTIMLTSKGIAKLCNFELCCQILSKRKKLMKPCKLDFSSEPQYENIMEFNIDSYINEEKSNNENYFESECAAQEISLRSLFAPYRWQSPELFDEFEGLVYPCLQTDVYSLCLVLWECCNNAIPWKTISYEQLCEIYFQWKTGIRLPPGLYPKIISDILVKGLSLKPKDRMHIEDLSLSLQKASVELNTFEEIYIYQNKSTLNANREDNNVSNTPLILPALKEVKNYEITNLDISNDSNFRKKTDLNNSSPQLDSNDPVTELDVESSKDCLSGDENDNTPNNTNSTEYCSLLTPAVARFTSQMMDMVSLNPLHISFEGQNSTNSEEEINTASEKLPKLSSIVTPRSYKSLQIETPNDEKLNSIRSLAKSFELKSSDDKKPTYTFEILSTSLPATPIARNTKIRKNAWLSGDNDKRNKITHVKEIRGSSLVWHKGEKSPTTNMLSIEENKFNDSKNITLKESPNVFEKVVNRGRRRHSLINVKSNSMFNDDQDNNNHPRENETSTESNIHPSEAYGRSRSQSLSSKSITYPKSMDDITGVNIKPIVAIHEKWIFEAKHKHNRSASSPNTFRNSFHAVKPASHLIDPLRPANSGSLHSYDSDSNKKKDSPKQGRYTDMSPMIRSSVLKKRVINSNPADFFEKSLWQKEKEICLSSANAIKNKPQNSSTPRTTNFKCDQNSVDKYTNTDTFEELCKKIVETSKYNTYTITPKNAKIKKQSFDHDHDYAEAKSSVLSELSISFDKTKTGDFIENKSNTISNDWVGKDLNENMNVTLTLGSPNKNIPVINEYQIVTSDEKPNEIKNEEVTLFCRNCNSPECGDDCVSLPDMHSQIDDPTNKALKRCQAFSALQDARSTEDMYIDDELTANMDIQNLGENMKLVPFDSVLHETLCDKGEDCCLIQIQEEAGCGRLLLFCDNNCKKSKSSSSSLSSCESEYGDRDSNNRTITKPQHALQIESLPSIDLIDFAPNNLLPIIEERSSEEDNDADIDSEGKKRGIQDLICLYERDNPTMKKRDTFKFSKNNYESTVKSKIPKKEISIFIMDNGESDDGNKSSRNSFANLTNPMDDVVNV